MPILPTKLSPQQERVLHGRENGLSFKEIADDCGITVRTAHDYWRRIVQKLGARASRDALCSGFEVPITFINSRRKAA